MGQNGTTPVSGTEQTLTRPPSPRVEGGVRLAGGAQREKVSLTSALAPTGLPCSSHFGQHRGLPSSSSWPLSRWPGRTSFPRLREASRRKDVVAGLGGQGSSAITDHPGGVRSVPGGGELMSHGRLSPLLLLPTRGKPAHRPRPVRPSSPGRWGRCLGRASPEP